MSLAICFVPFYNCLFIKHSKKGYASSALYFRQSNAHKTRTKIKAYNKKHLKK